MMKRSGGRVVAINLHSLKLLADLQCCESHSSESHGDEQPCIV